MQLNDILFRGSMVATVRCRTVWNRSNSVLPQMELELPGAKVKVLSLDGDNGETPRRLETVLGRAIAQLGHEQKFPKKATEMVAAVIPGDFGPQCQPLAGNLT